MAGNSGIPMPHLFFVLYRELERPLVALTIVLGVGYFVAPFATLLDTVSVSTAAMAVP